MNEYERMRREAQQAKAMYSPGTRLELISMDDPYAPVPSGTRGTVKYVDDAGQIGMAWDNGQSLSLVPGEDDFRQLTEEELSEGSRQVVDFGSKCKIRLPSKPMDCCKPGFLDKLREQCWELVKSYCTALGAEILPDENGNLPMDAEIAQKVQDSILNTLWEYGVEMRTDDFCIDADEMQALRTRLSHMDEDFLSDNNVYCFRSVDELFDYFYDEGVSKEELVRDLNTEQKVELLSSFKERILQADGMYYCYNEGFAAFEFDEDNAPSMEM